MICPMMLAGLMAGPDYTLAEHVTPDAFHADLCQCKAAACAWWMTDEKRCAVAVLARPAELAEVGRKREPA